MQLEIAVCLAETQKHVRSVQRNLNIFIRALMSRGETHDNSKFEEPELTIFAQNTAKLAAVEYGTPEYAALLKEVRPAIEHHYAKNCHHPEHFPNGINGMTLVDLIEMLSDWEAATARNKNGNIRKSLEVNAERYDISPQLQQILKNTVDLYFSKKDDIR